MEQLTAQCQQFWCFGDRFSEKINALNDTKTSEMAKSAIETGIFVIVCGICRNMDKKQISKSPNANSSLKTKQMLRKNKAWYIC